MGSEEILKLIRGGENQEVEFKEKFPLQATISKVICSFANTLGGTLIIGVTDDGEITGLDKNELDFLQRRISEAHKAISPIPLLSIFTHLVENKIILSVQIKKAHDQIYHTFQGAIYVRVGSTTQRLDGATQLDYLRQKQILSFDETFNDEATMEDIDPDKIRAYLHHRGREDFLETHSMEIFLVTNKLADRVPAGLRLKNPALLLFGRDPIFFYPQIEVKLVQFAGNEPVEIIDYRLVQEDVIRAIAESINFIKQKLSKRVSIGDDGRREEYYEYPLSVTRESIINAFTHRDYFSKNSIQINLFANKLEIISPGSLPSELTRELFGTVSVQRNPLTYRFLRDLGYVEGLGTGVPRIKSEMHKAGLPEPEFEFTENFVRVTLYNKNMSDSPEESITGKERLNRLNERQLRALEYLEQNDKLKAKEYSELNEVSYATAVNEINSMIDLGFIEKVGAYRGAYYIIST